MPIIVRTMAKGKAKNNKEYELMPNEELHLTKKDFNLDWYSGSGAGGQHRNKHQNCCRITHIESGLTAIGADSRSRITNQRDAFNRLAKLVISYFYSEDGKNRFNGTETIRNYHAVRNEVHDKSSGLKATYKEIVKDNNIDKMVKARRQSIAV